MTTSTPAPATPPVAPSVAAKKPRARRTPAERAQVNFDRAQARVRRAHDGSVAADAALRDAQAAKRAADVEVQAAEKALAWWTKHPELPKKAPVAGGAS